MNELPRSSLRPAPARISADLSPTLRVLGADAESLRHVALRQPDCIDMVELVRLHHSIDTGLGVESGGIVQFVSPTSLEGSREIAYGLAWAGATLLGKRVLFVDASQWTGERRLVPGAQVPKLLSDVAVGRAGVEEAIVKETNISLFVATLQHEKVRGDSVLAARQIKGLLDELRAAFDIIVIAPTPALDQPLAAILTAFVDGTVLVLEAGRSRARQASRAIDLLSSGGSPILGSVLVGERNYVPRWLRRWI